MRAPSSLSRGNYKLRLLFISHSIPLISIATRGARLGLAFARTMASAATLAIGQLAAGLGGATWRGQRGAGSDWFRVGKLNLERVAKCNKIETEESPQSFIGALRARMVE